MIRKTVLAAAAAAFMTLGAFTGTIAILNGSGPAAGVQTA